MFRIRFGTRSICEQQQQQQSHKHQLHRYTRQQPRKNNNRKKQNAKYLFQLMALFVLIVIYYAISDLNIQIYMLNVIEPVKNGKREK